jgi:NAD-dependent dihydropyrimidine dehydrogenase PreA subunit
MFHEDRSGEMHQLRYLPTILYSWRQHGEENKNGEVEIIKDECVECGLCLKANVCPVEAFYQQELPWPRHVRVEFSNPRVIHPSTKVGGRGTEEMKNNEITGRFQLGFDGVGMEFGRPSIGARFRDLQNMAQALVPLGVQFKPQNPVTVLMVDKNKGIFDPAILLEGDVIHRRRSLPKIKGSEFELEGVSRQLPSESDGGYGPLL